MLHCNACLPVCLTPSVHCCWVASLAACLLACLPARLAPNKKSKTQYTNTEKNRSRTKTGSEPWGGWSADCCVLVMNASVLRKPQSQTTTSQRASLNPKYTGPTLRVQVEQEVGKHNTPPKLRCPLSQHLESTFNPKSSMGVSENRGP